MASPNTVKSMMLGWVGLIGVAGASFYYTKKTINDRRRLGSARISDRAGNGARGDDASRPAPS
ncbi:hypothetical protein FA95DRAFT_1609959 [Auriscalpium vulgare]|uniref:Uncharacterized protein n=1 Tax=Auriscalpium vulgare TaxID=40419 RepID=A0ACB8RGI6_9AGAM|nr:hypothetical protein FA95DRAFT_1609959 [Auriscalpium vulgare]